MNPSAALKPIARGVAAICLLAGLAAEARAQSILTYSVQINEQGTITNGTAVIVLHPINPADSTKGPHTCDFAISNGASITPGTVQYATNQAFFGGSNALNYYLNLESAYYSVQKDGSVIFQSQASNSYVSFTGPGGLNSNYFAPLGGSLFSSPVFTVISGTTTLAISKDSKTLSGSMSLGGSNSPNSPFYGSTKFLNATVTGKLIKVQ